MLYDATRRLLDSRFLKKDETVKSGESLRFEGHLVDIEEIEGPVPLVNLKIEGRKCEEAAQSEGKSKTHNSNPVEWDAMYTTQVNQKAKKYHSGIIRLASSGSYRMQATLLSEDGMTLSRRYLKLSEDINGGSLFNMPNYLVEVGEPRKPSEGECPRKPSTSENKSPNIGSFEVDNIKLCKRIPATRPQSDGEPPKRASSLQDTDLKLRNSVADEIISTTINNDKPLRDARLIFSFLKKPSTQEGIVALEEEHHVSQSSAFVQTGIPHQVEGLQGSSNRPEVVSCNEGTSKPRDYMGEIVKCDTGLSAETIISANSDNRAEKQQKDYTGYDFSFGLETSVVSRSVSDVELTCTSKKMPSSCTVQLEPQMFQGLIMDSNGPQSTSSELYLESTGAVDIGGNPEVMSSKATSTINEPANEVKDQHNSQISGDMMIDSSTLDNNFCTDSTTLTNCIHHDDSNDGRKSLEEHTNLRFGDLPTFDLGFD